MALATGPLTPRWLACWLVNSWMTALYRRCSIAHMSPAYGSNHRFTGQCNDAFFQLAKQVTSAATCDHDAALPAPCFHTLQLKVKTG